MERRYKRRIAGAAFGGKSARHIFGRKISVDAILESLRALKLNDFLRAVQAVRPSVTPDSIKAHLQFAAEAGKSK